MTIKRRILLCRLGFVLFCVVPTFSVGLWTVARTDGGARASFAQAALAHELTSQLGLAVEIDRASGSPGAFRLEGVRLRDPETGAVVFQAVAVEAVHSATGWQIEAFQPCVEVAQLHRLAPRLHDRLLCGPANQMPPIALVARNLILATEKQQVSVAQLSARMGANDSGPEVVAELNLADPSSEPIRFTIARDQKGVPPQTRWQLATGNQSIPTSPLADIVPPLSRLGRNCQFVGMISGEGGQRGWSGELAGTLGSVDFDALVTEHFPHQLSGLGTIRVAQAVMTDGRLAELRGGIEIRTGTISESLLAAAEEHLQLVPASPNQSTNEFSSIPFDRLAMGLALDGRLLRIRGVTGTNDDVVLTSQSGPLLRAGPGHAVPAVNLLRALLPENQFQVPATRQTEALVGLLPVPEADPTRTAARQTHVPTRLRSSGPADAAPVLRQPGLR
jgi:hypothetical protein